MTGRLTCNVLCGGIAALALVTATTRAEPPAPEVLPAPREVQTEIVLSEPWLPLYHRVSRYEVWQNYGVDRRGYFKPLVVYSPYGAYYRYNGHPFPWAQNHPLEWMPYIVD
jgi:hypothetical protein